jgi:hypothetical protein
MGCQRLHKGHPGDSAINDVLIDAAKCFMLEQHSLSLRKIAFGNKYGRGEYDELDGRV